MNQSLCIVLSCISYLFFNFFQALDDEIYVNLYAKLCDEMMSKFPVVSLEHFRNVLSGLCQTGFDNLLNLTVSMRLSGPPLMAHIGINR